MAHLGDATATKGRDQEILNEIGKTHEDEILRYAQAEGISIWHAQEELAEALVMVKE